MKKQSVAKYLDSLTRREGKKHSINRADMGEAFKILDDDSRGIITLLLKAGVFPNNSGYDGHDVLVMAIKALAKEL